MPWDSDIDVQVSETSMHYLAAYHNMSVFHYKTPRITDGRDYMLEINPHYNNRDKQDTMNHIDARWIDTESGLFIDITAVRYDVDHPRGPNMLVCKDGHEYKVGFISRYRTPALTKRNLGYRYFPPAKDFLRRDSSTDTL